MRIIVTILLTLIITTTAHAIFKWRDAEGKLHFSDTPPISTPQTEPINVVQNQVAETRVQWAKKQEARSETAKRLAQVDEEARKWREKNIEFSKQECNAALKAEQTILESIRLDQDNEALFAADLNILRRQKRIACP